MPTYDYRCLSGHQYEKKQPFGSPAQHPCEECGEEAQRLLSVPALTFRGTGFYTTDSRKSDDDSKESARRSAGEKAPEESVPATVAEQANGSQPASADAPAPSTGSGGSADGGGATAESSPSPTAAASR